MFGLKQEQRRLGLQVDNTPTVLALTAKDLRCSMSPALVGIEDEYRTVSFQFHDVSGFSNSSLSAFLGLKPGMTVNTAVLRTVYRNVWSTNPCFTPTRQ